MREDSSTIFFGCLIASIIFSAFHRSGIISYLQNLSYVTFYVVSARGIWPVTIRTRSETTRAGLDTLRQITP